MLCSFFLLFFLTKLSSQDILQPFSIFPTTSNIQVIKVGENVVLSCRASRKWALCSWIDPKGISCDRLEENHFQPSCEKNPRIKYDIDTTEFQETDCSITLVDVNLSDDGEWTCLLKDDIHNGEGIRSIKNLKVASAFKVHIDSPLIDQKRETISFVNRTTKGQFSCSAKGIGSVKPTLFWIVDGEPAKSEATKAISETYENQTTAVFSDLTLSPDYFDEETILSSTNKTHLDIKLVCLSKQIDQKGIVLYQSSVTTFVTIEVREKEIIPELMMNPAGITLATIVVFTVIVAIAFICWARSKKRYCFEAEDYRSRAVPGPVAEGGNQPSAEAPQDAEEAVELLGSASFNRSSSIPRSILTNGSLGIGENLRSPPTEIVTFQTNGNDNEGDFQPSSPKDPVVRSFFTGAAKPGSPRISVSFEPVATSMPTESTANAVDVVDLPENPSEGGEQLENPSPFELTAVLRLSSNPLSSPPSEPPPVPPQEEVEDPVPGLTPEASEDTTNDVGPMALENVEQSDHRTGEIPGPLELPPRSAPSPPPLMPKPTSPKEPSDIAERLLELISDAPTSPVGPQHVSLWPSSYSRSRLSESLITPRQQNVRQRNQYVTLSRPGSTHGLESNVVSPLPEANSDPNRPFSETSL